MPSKSSMAPQRLSPDAEDPVPSGRHRFAQSQGTAPARRQDAAASAALCMLPTGRRTKDRGQAPGMTLAGYLSDRGEP